MKTGLLAGVMLLAIFAASVQGITVHRMDANITGASGEFCANQSIYIVAFERYDGWELKDVDVDVYYGRGKVENLLTNRSGFTSFVPVNTGEYRISLEKTLYRDIEEFITVNHCIVATTTTTSTTTTTLCPDAADIDPLWENNCLTSGGTTVEKMDDQGCVTSVECKCPYETGGNWTCLPMTTSTTTTIGMKEQADIYYNRSLGYFNAGDYNETKELVEKACEIYQQLQENLSLKECQILARSIDQVIETTTTVVTTTLPVEKPNSRAWAWIPVILVISGIALFLMKQKPKEVTKLGGEPEPLKDERGGTTLGEI